MKVKVIGAIDDQTRCRHYHSERDIIAIKFKCCETYYPCIFCHEEQADHQVEVWPTKEFDTKAVPENIEELLKRPELQNEIDEIKELFEY